MAEISPRSVKRSARIPSLTLPMMLAVFSVVARGETMRLEPSIFVAETFTDNVDAAKNGRSDWITEISPTVSVNRTGGRVTGTLDASFRNFFFVEDGSLSTSFLTLTGKGVVEVIDDSLFIDVRSAIGRSNQSSFKGRPQWDTLNSSSQSETRYISITPRWVGHVGKSDVQFSMSYDGQALSYGSGMSNQRMGTYRARLFDPKAGASFGWSIDYSDSDNSYSDSDQKGISDRRLTGTLIYHVSSQFLLRGIVGTEKNNYLTGQDDSGTVTGYGFNWRPTPRTTIDGTFENHVYGDTYDIRLSHRWPSSAISVGLTQNITSAFQTATNSLGAYYYNLISSSLASQFPDAVQRDQATRQVMKDLGISTGNTFGNFSTNAFFVDRRIQAGFSLIGARHTLAFSAYHADQEKANDDQVVNPDDNFASNNTVKSWGGTVSLTHRLTPTSSLNGSFFWSESDGSGGGPEQSRRNRGVTAGYSEQLNQRAFGAVYYRHQTASGVNPFTENSVTASVSMLF
jgi:uncharacterized protein (PEP-CTERM system associated)